MASHIPFYNNSLPAPEPDLNSGMAALQMATSTKVAASGKAKPSIPQKKSHVDELIRLRKELEELRAERDQAHRERDAMEDDLLQAQEDLEQKIDELGKKSKDLEEKSEELSKKSKEVWTWREKAEKAERLSNDMAIERRFSGSDRRSLGSGNASPLPTKEANGKVEAELGQARQQIQQLMSELAETKTLLDTKTASPPVPKVNNQNLAQEAQRQFQTQLAQVENHWRSEALEQQKLRQIAEAGLNDTKVYYENKLKDVEFQAQSQIAEHQRQLQETKIGCQEPVQQMEVDSPGTEELDRLRRLAAEQEESMNSQRQCAEQYRRMNERLTTQIKQANMAQRKLEQSEQSMRQQVENMKSQITILQRQQHVKPMPGAFRTY